MDKIIDPVILKAFELLREEKEFTSDYQVATYLEVNKQIFGRWKNGRIKSISEKYWKSVSKKIEPYIPRAKSILANSYEDMKLFFEYQVKIHAMNYNQLMKLKTMFDSMCSNLNDVIEAGSSDDYELADEPITIQTFKGGLPYIRQQVAAGNGCEILDERYHDRPDMHYLGISGESMEPNFHDGQKIVVQLYQERITFGDQYLSIEEVKSIIPEDSIIIYNLNDSGLSMKRVKYQKNQKSWYFILHADNEEWAEVNDFPRIIRKTDDFEIFGKIVRG